jgi:WD40 repeat protein
MSHKLLLGLFIVLLAGSINSQNLIPFKAENGKYGFKASNAETVIIPPKYMIVYNFSHGYALVSKDEKNWEYIDGKGKSKISFYYDKNRFGYGFHVTFDEGFNGYFFQTIKNKFLTIQDTNGNYLTSKLYQGFRQIYHYSSDVPSYEEMEKLGMYIGETKRSIDIFNKYGQQIATSPNFKDIIYIPDSIIGVKSGSGYRFTDYFGKPAIPINIDYTKYYKFSEGLAAVPKGDKWGYIDKKGKTIIPFDFSNAFNFNNCKAKVSFNRKYGIINKNGEYLIDPDYRHISPLTGNRYILIKEDKYGIADAKGRIIVEPTYDYISQFKNGVAKTILGNNTQYIDTTGNYYDKNIQPELLVTSFGDMLTGKIQVSHSGKYLVHNGGYVYPNTLFLWDVLQEKELLEIEIERFSKFSTIVSYCFSPDDKYLILLCAHNESGDEITFPMGIIIYNIHNGLVVNHFDYPQYFMDNQLNSELAFQIITNRLGDQIIFSSQSYIVFVDFYSGEVLMELPGSNAMLNISNDGKYIASVQDERGMFTVARIFDISNGEIVDQFSVIGLTHSAAYFLYDSPVLKVGNLMTADSDYSESGFYDYKKKKLKINFRDESKCCIEPFYYSRNKITVEKKKLIIDDGFKIKSVRINPCKLLEGGSYVVPSPNGRYLVRQDMETLNMQFYDIKKKEIAFNLKALKESTKGDSVVDGQWDYYWREKIPL